MKKRDMMIAFAIAAAVFVAGFAIFYVFSRHFCFFAIDTELQCKAAYMIADVNGTPIETLELLNVGEKEIELVSVYSHACSDANFSAYQKTKIADPDRPLPIGIGPGGDYFIYQRCRPSVMIDTVDFEYRYANDPALRRNSMYVFFDYLRSPTPTCVLPGLCIELSCCQ
jgi:hypothetical protein